MSVPGFFGPLLPLPPLLPQPPTHTKATRRMASEHAKAPLLCGSGLVNPAREIISAKTQNTSRTMRNKPNGGIRGYVIRGTPNDGAVVVTLIANGEADALGVTVAGEAVQTAKEGAPVQVSATVPVNPLSGEICRL